MFEQNKRIFILIACAVLALVFLFIALGKQDNPVDQNGLTEQPEKINTALEPGVIGEVEEQDDQGQTGEQKQPEPSQPELFDLPSLIPSTPGVVVRVDGDDLIVLGSGNNFADHQSRELTCIFDDNTLTTSQNGTKYRGMSGLTILEQGMEVLVSGAENLRGKTEFLVQAIKVIK